MGDGKSMENKKDKKISKIKEQLALLRAKLKADDKGHPLPKSKSKFKTKPKLESKPKPATKPKPVSKPKAEAKRRIKEDKRKKEEAK